MGARKIRVGCAKGMQRIGGRAEDSRRSRDGFANVPRSVRDDSAKARGCEGAMGARRVREVFAMIP